MSITNLLERTPKQHHVSRRAMGAFSPAHHNIRSDSADPAQDPFYYHRQPSPRRDEKTPQNTKQTHEIPVKFATATPTPTPTSTDTVATNSGQPASARDLHNTSLLAPRRESSLREEPPSYFVSSANTTTMDAPLHRTPPRQERSPPSIQSSTEVPALVSHMEGEMQLLKAEIATLRHENYYLQHRDEVPVMGSHGLDNKKGKGGVSVSETVRMGARLQAAESSAKSAQEEAAELRKVIDGKNAQLALVTENLDDMKDEMTTLRQERDEARSQISDTGSEGQPNSGVATPPRKKSSRPKRMVSPSRDDDDDTSSLVAENKRLKEELLEAQRMADDAVKQVKKLSKELHSTQNALKRTERKLLATEEELVMVLDGEYVDEEADAAMVDEEPLRRGKKGGTRVNFMDAEDEHSLATRGSPSKSSRRGGALGAMNRYEEALAARPPLSRTSTTPQRVSYDGKLAWYRGNNTEDTSPERQAQAARGKALDEFLGSSTPQPTRR